MRPHGRVGPDGRFTLTTYQPGDGAPTGKYNVTVVWPGPVPGTSVIPGDDKVPGALQKQCAWRIAAG